MKIVRLTCFAGPDGLVTSEVPDPVPGPGEILVRVKAAGVNFFETLMLGDHYTVTPELPAHLGVEVAGVVEAAGPGSAGPPAGTRVAAPLFAFGRYGGGYAEYVAAPAEAVLPIPDSLSFEAAVGLQVQGLTALHALKRTPPHGRTVLVSGARGGVGGLLIQLARRAGAERIIGLAGAVKKLDAAQAWGPDRLISYLEPAWVDTVLAETGGLGVGAAYDFVGGSLSRQVLAALAPCGEVLFGALGRFALTPGEIEAAVDRNQSLKGFSLLPLLHPAAVTEDLRHLFALAADGELTVPLGGAFPLADAAIAHREIAARRTTGKVVLVP